MLERLHEHMVNELGQSSRTDTIFIVVAVLFNLVALGINSGFADRYEPSTGDDLILGVLMVMTIVVNTIAINGLMVGRKTRERLLNGLVSMYVDNQIEKYYDSTLIKNYSTRYKLFAGVILVLAITAILVPLIIRLV